MRSSVLLVALSLAACQPRDPTPAGTAPSGGKAKTAEAAPPADAPYALPGMEAERPSARPPAPRGEDRQNPDSWTARPEGTAPDCAAAERPTPECPDGGRPVPEGGVPEDGGAPSEEDDRPQDGDVASRGALDDAVAAYLVVSAGNDVGAMLGLYADRVRYYDRGVVSQAAIREDKARYVARWPDRTFAPTETPRVTYRGGDRRATVRFDYDYAVRGPGRRRSGRAWTELTYAPADQGQAWQIVAERGGTR